MKRSAYSIDKVGSIDNLRMKQEELPMPGDHEVTIEVKAIGLNFADIFAIQGLYKAAPKENLVPGLEYSGVVMEVGKKVLNFNVGDRIMGVTRFGAYASHLNIDSRYIFPLQDDWSFEEGASFLVQVLTAYYGLVYLGAIEKDSTVLIHSAAGGVGLWANRIAKNFEAYTIGVVGSDRKIDFCKKEGYNEVIVRSENFEHDLKKSLKGRSLNLIMDSIGGKIFKIGYKMLASQGRVVVYGSARYTSKGSKPNFLKLLWLYWQRPKIDPQTMINFNKAVMGFNLIYLYEKVGLMEKLLRELKDVPLQKPIVGHSFSFKKLHDAVYFFQSGDNMGKVVVTL